MRQRVESVDPFVGGGAMGRLMRAHDWSATPLGPVAGWPQSLRTAVRIMLGSRYPMFIWWGRELVNLYNDGYLPMLGQRHPAALGKPAAVIWSEIWDTIGAQADVVLHEGRATWNEERLLVLERNGYPEEAYFTFSYSPVPADDGGVGGIFCALTEDTQRVVGQRRLRALRELSARTTGARTVEQACHATADTLGQNPHDLPFTLIYLLDGDGGVARLAGMSGLADSGAACPPAIDLAAQGTCWPLDQVAVTGRPELLENLESRCGRLRCGVWPDPPQSAMVLPLMQSGQDRLAGFLVAGISPRRVFDDDYRGFLEMLAGQVATAIANARSYEEEKRRAESLAELDRAKTAFFSNVSHEFRTPLTLMLGPVEDVLADSAEPPTPRQQECLEVARRNALRLQKLVNTLLDFSRIEAGRVQASYEPVDLAALTADLASNFRSACEKAGVVLRVDCPPLPEPVYVDREMWEKIVLNLVSNAFKYTLHGEIGVALRQVDGQAILSVRDTGTGIPPDQLPLLFERFHRVAGARGRTQEGTGIGLALVKELAQLHGGGVRAESELGRGSVFTVAVPLGRSHLPAGRIGTASTLAPTALGAAPYVEEALRWLPNSLSGPPAAIRGSVPPGVGQRPRLLLADDNADMRDYIGRLLGGLYEVEAVPDGLAALNGARRRQPDLILADVMMPGLDGFGLLQALRGDPGTATVPILLLSARAGEEARVEGLRAGADDYLTKPFSARELLARVQAHLALARMRREAGAALQQSERFHRLIADLTSDFTYSIRLNDGAASPSVDFISPGFTAITGYSPEELNAGGGWPSIVYPDDLPVTARTVERMIAGQKDEAEVRLLTRDGEVRWVRYLSQPVTDAAGRVTGFIGAVQHVTDRKKAEEALRETNAILHSFYNTAPVMMGVVEVVGNDILHLTDNAATGRFFGVGPNSLAGRRASDLGVPPDHLREWVRHYRASEATGQPVRFEYTHETPGGIRRVSAIVYCIERLPDDRSRCSYVAEDVTERTRVEESLRQSEERFRQLAENVNEVFWMTDPQTTQLLYISPAYERVWGRSCQSLHENPRSFMDAVHPEDRERVQRDVLERQSRGEQVDKEYRVVRPDGSIRWVRDRAFPVKNAAGQFYRLVGIIDDFTDKRRSEETIRSLLHIGEKLNSTLDVEELLDLLVTEAIGLVDAQSGVAGLSGPEGMRCHRYLQRGQRLPLEYCWPPMHGLPGWLLVHKVPYLTNDALTDTQIVHELCVQFDVRSALSTPILSAHGEVLGFFEIHNKDGGFTPADQQKLLAVSHAASIAIQNALAYRRIQQAEESLRDANRRKDEFLATLAHELRNPLAPIRNAVELIRRANGDEAVVEQARSLMERQVGQMVRLVDDLLDISRITRGKLHLRTERIELAAVVRSAVEACRPLIDAHAHELTVTLPHEPVHLDGDPVRLAQVFSNLLNNAAKYMDRGGCIWLTAERQGPVVVVSVRDTGIGIAADHLPCLFEMFSQVESALERTQGGLGIGLALVRGLVGLHGGRIEAHSAGPGKGSEFTVWLPVVETPTEAHLGAGAVQEKHCGGAKCRILVADDLRDSADSLALMLRLAGHEVWTAHDGLEAVQAAAAFRPDVALLDIGMPKMNGYEAARYIRQQPWGKRLVLIALTGWGQPEDRRRTAEAGFDHHLVKPIEPKALEELLADLSGRAG